MYLYNANVEKKFYTHKKSSLKVWIDYRKSSLKVWRYNKKSSLKVYFTSFLLGKIVFIFIFTALNG